MRQLTVILFLCLAFVGAAAPMAQANKYSPKSGTTFKLRPGKKATIKVVGFQGCKMEAFASVGDSDVVKVSTTSGSSKSPKVTVTAVGPGSTFLDISLSSESPSCELPGFFTFTVEPDPKAFVKQAKGKLKQMKKDIKSDLNAALKLGCDGLDAVKDLIDPDETKAAELIQDLFPAVEDYQFTIEDIVQERLQETYVDIWGRADESGFLTMTPDLAGYLDGGCGAWDKCVVSALKMVEGANKKLFKKYKGVIKSIDKAYGKGEQGEALIAVDALGVTPALTAPITLPAEMPAPATPPVPKPLKKSWSAAGRMSSDTSALMRVGGTVEAGGGDVTVKVTGPGGDVVMKQASVNDDCEFSAEFDELTPGTYHVEMTLGDEKVTFTKYVP